MAKTPKQPEKKPRWYQLIAQAYKATAPRDKMLLPYVIGTFVIILGISIGIGVSVDSTAGLVYSILFGFLTAVLGALYVMVRRFEKVMMESAEGQMGSSLYVAQTIRRGWEFMDQPASIDPRGSSVVFQGVGRRGVVLLAEGGNAATKQVTTLTQRLKKLLPGVPVSAIYVGTGEGQVPLQKLVKAIHKVPAANKLSTRERNAVSARLKAIGSAKLPVPKGIDPMKARPSRRG